MTQDNLTVEKIKNRTEIENGVYELDDGAITTDDISIIAFLLKQVDKQQIHIEVQFNKINALTKQVEDVTEEKTLWRVLAGNRAIELESQEEEIAKINSPIESTIVEYLKRKVESQKEEIASWHTTQDKKLGRVIVETTEKTATRCAEIAKKWHIGCVKAIRTEFQLPKEE